MCRHERAGVTSVRCSGMSRTEPPVCCACCFSREPRCASALLRLYSTSHSNLRDWERKARWTFFNNEGILCLQYSTWLTCTGWAALQQFKGRQTLIMLHQVFFRSFETQSTLIIPTFIFCVDGRGRQRINGSSRVLRQSEKGMIDS